MCAGGTHPCSSNFSRPAKDARDPKPPDDRRDHARSFRWVCPRPFGDAYDIGCERVEGVEVGVGGEHQDVDGDEGVNGGEDVRLIMQDAVGVHAQYERLRESGRWCAHRGMEKRSSRTKDSCHVRERTPRFGAGKRPFRQTYSVLARTTGCEMRSSASTSGAEESVRRRSRAV